MVYIGILNGVLTYSFKTQLFYFFCGPDTELRAGLVTKDTVSVLQEFTVMLCVLYL